MTKPNDTAANWEIGNSSLKAAHGKYCREFEIAYNNFRDFSGATEQDLIERKGLWLDYANRGENIISWYRKRQC